MTLILLSGVIILLLYMTIAAIWQQAEKRMDGKVTIRKIDEWIAIILAVSIYFNGYFILM